MKACIKIGTFEVSTA